MKYVGPVKAVHQKKLKKPILDSIERLSKPTRYLSAIEYRLLQEADDEFSKSLGRKKPFAFNGEVIKVASNFTWKPSISQISVDKEIDRLKSVNRQRLRNA